MRIISKKILDLKVNGNENVKNRFRSYFRQK